MRVVNALPHLREGIYGRASFRSYGINKKAEENASANYWSATENSEDNARRINFSNGNTNNNNKTNSNRVRCVLGNLQLVFLRF